MRKFIPCATLVGLFGVDPVTHIQPTCYDLRKMVETLELIYMGLTFCGYAWQITMTCLYSFLFFWEKQLVSILNKRKKNNMNTAFKSVKKQYKRNFIVDHHQEVIFLSLFLNAERVKCYLISTKVLLLKIKKEKFSKKQNKVFTKKTLYRLLGTFSFSFFFYILVNYLSIALIKLDKCLKCECKGWNLSP